MTNLGVMYDTGEGVIEDDVEAYAWFNVATAKGQKKAAESREYLKKDPPLPGGLTQPQLESNCLSFGRAHRCQPVLLGRRRSGHGARRQDR